VRTAAAKVLRATPQPEAAFILNLEIAAIRPDHSALTSSQWIRA
jgi:hypothetical protein